MNDLSITQGERKPNCNAGADYNVLQHKCSFA